MGDFWIPGPGPEWRYADDFFQEGEGIGQMRIFININPYAYPFCLWLHPTIIQTVGNCHAAPRCAPGTKTHTIANVAVHTVMPHRGAAWQLPTVWIERGCLLYVVSYTHPTGLRMNRKTWDEIRRFSLSQCHGLRQRLDNQAVMSRRNGLAFSLLPPIVTLWQHIQASIFDLLSFGLRPLDFIVSSHRFLGFANQQKRSAE